MKRKTRLIEAFSYFLAAIVVGSIGFLGVIPTAQARVRLSAQDVVDRVLSQGPRAKIAGFEAQRASLAYERALGVFDFQLKIVPYYEYSEAQNLSSSSNLMDRTSGVNAVLQKNFRTGSLVSLEYVYTKLESVFPALSNTTRPPQASLNAAQASLRQALWRNSFGYADRSALEIGRNLARNAGDARSEQLEAVLLESITQYWNLYVAERQLKENMAGREKYEELVRNTRRKAGLNLSAPGELARLQAELEIFEQKVKSSSVGYLNSLRLLKTLIRLEGEEAVEIEVADPIPPLPKLSAKKAADLRSVRVARTGLDNAKLNHTNVRSVNQPRLDLVLRAKTTGVDEDRGASVAEMTAATKPTYYVGVEFETALDSDTRLAATADARLQEMIREAELTLALDSAFDLLESSERSVVAQHAIAKSAVETVELRERVVKQVEGAYRQGRQPLVELIRAYNDLFNSRVERARAIGQYHILLNQLAAARDELVVQ